MPLSNFSPFEVFARLLDEEAETIHGVLIVMPVLGAVALNRRLLLATVAQSWETDTLWWVQPEVVIYGGLRNNVSPLTVRDLLSLPSSHIPFVH